MRIAQLTAWYPPHSIGGTEIYVEALSAALRQMGHDVAVAGPLAGPIAPERLVHKGVPVLRYPIPSTPTKDEARGRVRTRGSEHLTAWLAEYQPDIVHVHSLTTGLQLPELAAASAGSRVLLTLHLPTLTYVCERGTLALWGRRACDGVRQRRRCAACALEARGVPLPLAWSAAAIPVAAARRARRWAGPLATVIAMPSLIEELASQQRDLFAIIDAAVALNTMTVDILEKNGAPSSKVTLNALGISHAARPKPSPEAAPTTRPVRVGFFGRLSRDKGIEDLLHAIDMLPRDVPMTFVFHAITGSPGADRLGAGIRALAARRAGVEVEPMIAPDAMPQALAGVDVLCSPSRWFENGPTVALEAIAAGTPVIGTRLGAFADFVEDGVNGRLLPPGDVPALARTLHEVAVDPAGTIDRWRSRLPSVRTMKEISADYDRLYHRVMAAHASPVA